MTPENVNPRNVRNNTFPTIVTSTIRASMTMTTRVSGDYLSEIQGDNDHGKRNLDKYVGCREVIFIR